MSPDANHMPASQLARWLAIAVLLLGAVALYFREGRRVPPLGSAPAAPETTATR